jgi:hypothetical protein
MLAYFLALGMIEAFINCLIMPLVTLGIPLITWCLYNHKQNGNQKKQIIDLISLSAAWGAGYAGTFMSSWIISAFFKHQSPVESVATGIKAFLFRAGVQDSNIIATLAKSIYANINRNIPFLWLILLFAGVLVMRVIKRRTRNVVMLLPLLIVSSYPFLWIVILSNHSSIHAWMVHDIFSISIWGLLLVSYYLLIGVSEKHGVPGGENAIT